MSKDEAAPYLNEVISVTGVVQNVEGQTVCFSRASRAGWKATLTPHEWARPYP